MQVIKSILIFVLVCSFCQIIHGQTYEYLSDFQVIHAGTALSNPTAGGLNATHFGMLDLNRDDQEELVVFDRSSNLPYVFEVINGEYIINHDLAELLPEIQNWMVIRDFNSDGRKDIFTHTSFGVRVHENVSTADEVVWEIAAENLKTMSGESLVNLVVTSSDYPAIDDYDKDGDIDILVFDFAAGNNITFYENIKDAGSDEYLNYNKTDNFWAGISECNCEDFTFQENPCGSSGGRVEHAVPKSLTFYNNDLYIGVEGCDPIHFLPNSGSFINPQFDELNLDQLSGTDFGSYPVIFFEDFDNDGIDDAVVSNNQRDDNFFLDYNNSVWFFRGPDYTLQTNSFLQNTMIDVGEQSYPTWFDWDKDGDLDLFIGNKGEDHSGTYYGTIYYYENTGSPLFPRFELVTEDFANLSQYQFIKLNPTFGDFDGDGENDLILASARIERLFARVNYFKGTTTGTFEEPIEWDINFQRSDITQIIDFDGNGLLDFFLCRSFGLIERYELTGDITNPIQTLVDSSFLNLVPDGSNINPTLGFFNLDQDPELEIIKSDARGLLEVYQDANDENPITLNRFNALTEIPVAFNLGMNNPISFGDIYSNGRIIGALGSVTGGIRMIQLKTETGQAEDNILVFPNPVQPDRTMRLISPIDDQIIISDMSGKVVRRIFDVPADVQVTLQFYDLLPGMYIAKGLQSSAKFYIR